MNIIVTGANGQLAQCIKKQYKVYSNNENNFTFCTKSELDITDIKNIEDFFKNNHVDILINCAAYTNVDKAEDEPELAYSINHIGVKNLAEECYKYNATLIHISTDYVFGGVSNIPYKETDVVSPLGIYGNSKLKGENAIAESGCNYIIIRTSWLYSAIGKNFLKTMANLMSTRDKLNVVFDQVGTPTNADDLANAIYKIITEKKYISLTNKSGKIQEIFHYSNLGVCSWFDFATEIKNAGNFNCSVNPCHSSEFPSKVTRPAYSVLDKSKFTLMFNIDIPYWRDSVCRTIKELKILEQE